MRSPLISYTARLRRPSVSASIAASLLLTVAALTLVYPAASDAATKSAKPSVAPPRAPLDFGVEVDPPPNDRCDTAILIPCGNIDLSGNSSLATNDYSPSDEFCTGFLAQGQDVAYRLVVAAGDSLWLDYTTAFDGSVYVVSNCAAISATCVTGADSVNAAGVERIRHKFTSAGTYYLILDAFGVAGGGAWTASGQLVCGSTPLPPNDVCANAITVLCGPFSLSGTTQFALDDYGFPSAGASCTGQIADGRDVVYELNVTAGDSLWVDYTTTTNGSVYLMSTCDPNGATCVAGRDLTSTGAMEQLRYKFVFSGQYFLVLDSRANNTFGNWTANGGVVCGLSVPSNDVCASAIEIPCGEIALSGSTQLAANNYAFPDEFASCTDFLTDGREVVYVIDAIPGQILEFDYNSTTDGAAYLVTNCADIVNSCVYGVDDNVEGETEHFQYTFTSAGTYYLILDSYGPDTWGAWQAIGVWNCSPVSVGPARDPSTVAFAGAYPNPFRATTILEYTMATAAHAALRVYDLQGRRVRELFEGERTAGQHRAIWDGRDDNGAAVGPGVYFAQLESDGQVARRRLIFVR